MWRLVCLLAVGGCAFGARFGGAGPTSHGHGGGNADVQLDWGFDHRGENVRTGLSLQTGLHGPGEPGYVALGLEAKADVGLTKPRPSGFRMLGVAALGAGFEDERVEMMSRSAGGYVQTFLGVGIGSTDLPESDDDAIRAGHVAVGLIVRAVRLDNDNLWMIGGALSIAFSVDDRRALAKLDND